MNSSAQSKNGFKTFIITLSVSMVIFTAIYYVVTGSNSGVSIEENNSVVTYSVEKDDDSSSLSKNRNATRTVDRDLDDEEESVFGKLTARNDTPEPSSEPVPNAELPNNAGGEGQVAGVNTNTTSSKQPTEPAVLQATTETEETTTETTTTEETTTEESPAVPETGMTSVTLGFLLSLSAISAGLYMVAFDPRRRGIKGFEKDVLKKL